MATIRERSKALGVITDAIKTIENFVKNYDAEVDRDKIESRLSRLDLLYDRYIEASIGVELLLEEKSETKATFVKSRNEMEEKYYTLHDFLTANRTTRHVAANPSPVSTSVVRLPKIDLPTFDGQIDNWIPFYDAYRSLIHNNKDLAAVDRFHYLMAALKEPVKKLLDTTSITGDNYRIAWDLLVSRFDNKRLLIKNHISSLFAIEPVKKESSAAILALVDQFERHVKILTTLGEQTEQWSSLLVHMVCSRLNQSTLREWERSTGSDKEKIPTYDELITFLKDQARILLSLNSGNLVPSLPKDKPRLSVAHTASVANTSPSKSFSCIVCNQQHRIYDCEVFNRMPIEQKQDTVRKKKLCWNCLSSSHLSRDCSSKPCWKCNEKHHTLLHASSPNDRSTQPQVKPPAGSQQSTTNIGSESISPALLSTPTPSTTTSTTQQTLTNALAAASSSTTTFSTVLLSTAMVKVHGPSGKSTFVRTLLDSCSESNFITERIVQLLGLTRRKQAAVIAGMGGSTVNSTNSTVATFSSVDSTYSNTLLFSILPKITIDLPARPINISQWNLPPELILADPDFATPQRIDMVIGAQLFFSLLRAGQMLVGSGPPQYQPVLQRTVLGWVVSGTVSTDTPVQEAVQVSLLCTTDNLDQQLTRFGEVESCPKSHGLSKEESSCEQYFAETTTRDESGRFVVRLPKKDHLLSQLGDSKSGALLRFNWMQRRLDKNPELKSRVAPIQTLSIPRLELCSAGLLSQLNQNVILSLNVNANAYCWSDSSITLHWLHNPPSNFNTFVANLVAEVQRLTEGGSWDHFAGLENPADLISRGVNPCELANIALWWKGPPWLTSDPAEWPRMFPVEDTSEFPPEVVEAKSCKLAAVTRSTEAPDCTLFTRYSSLRKLVRIAAYCRRFVRYCRVKMAGFDLHAIPYLTSAELLQVQEGLVRVVQDECFSHEIALLQARSEADLKKSPLRTLNPFIHDGLLLVGGRLNHSSYSFTRKHPMLLPAVHPFTSLLVDSVHKQLLHAGPRAMIAHIRERFWPLNLRNLARKQVKSCVRCYRIRPQPEHQLMGQLPKVRITPARAFLNTGVDFCGPVWLKASLRRTKPGPPIRAYVAVFVCMTTKAVHLELVGDLSSEAFIAALKRFVARRGKPIALFCDNATNFKGADRELRDLCKQLNDQQLRLKVATFCAESSIQFSYIPANAPTFGGLWEAAVKAFKHHFRRVVGLESLSSDAMRTILCQIESCLNSRPLSALSEDPSDTEVLTPGHFLVGSALQSIPEPDLAQVPNNRLSLWQEMQRRTQTFWKLWSTDYLHQLQQRSKHFYRQPNVLVGKLVLLKDDNLPPLKWSAGRIEAVHPGADGLVRVVTVRLASGAVYDRPIVKICLLPIDSEDNPTSTSGEVPGRTDDTATPTANPDD